MIFNYVMTYSDTYYDKSFKDAMTPSVIAFDVPEGLTKEAVYKRIVEIHRLLQLQKISEDFKVVADGEGHDWYNNGIENKKAFSCPPGWQKGKLHKNEPKKVICVETGEIFYSKDVPGAHKVCNGYRKTYKGYHWKWYNLEGGVSENFDNS